MQIVKRYIFVGDTMVDMQTAKNARMIAIGVFYGVLEMKRIE